MAESENETRPTSSTAGAAAADTSRDFEEDDFEIITHQNDEDQYVFECEILAEGAEGARRWEGCKKYPGHPEFIPLSEFSTTNLPREYRNEDVLKGIRSLAGLTGKLSVTRTSENRSEDDPFRRPHSGTGLVQRRICGLSFPKFEISHSPASQETDDDIGASPVASAQEENLGRFARLARKVRDTFVSRAPPNKHQQVLAKLFQEEDKASEGAEFVNYFHSDKIEGDECEAAAAGSRRKQQPTSFRDFVINNTGLGQYVKWAQMLRGNKQRGDVDADDDVVLGPESTEKRVRRKMEDRLQGIRAFAFHDALSYLSFYGGDDEKLFDGDSYISGDKVHVEDKHFIGSGSESNLEEYFKLYDFEDEDSIKQFLVDKFLKREVGADIEAELLNEEDYVRQASAILVALNDMDDDAEGNATGGCEDAVGPERDNDDDDNKNNSDVEDAKKTYGRVHPCPCPECVESETPQATGFYLNVMTARHVVFDSLEAKHTVVDLFYDDEKSETKRNVKHLYGVDMKLFHPSGDWAILVCVTHDYPLVCKLQDLLADLTSFVERVKKTSVYPVSIICSHPHGVAKRITVGKWLSRKVCYENDWNKLKFKEMQKRQIWTNYTYDTPTCMGSSGAAVLLLGHKRGTTPIDSAFHPHFGSQSRYLNKSGTFVSRFSTDVFHNLTGQAGIRKMRQILPTDKITDMIAELIRHYIELLKKDQAERRRRRRYWKIRLGHGFRRTFLEKESNG